MGFNLGLKGLNYQYMLGLPSFLRPCRQHGPFVSVTALVFVSLLVAAEMDQL
jgi:hypothetical protein